METCLFLGALALTWATPLPSQAQERALQVEFVPTARTQIAIWIERNGEFLRTLRLTQSVAYRGIGNRPGASQMNSGFRWPYGRREGVLPVWAHRRMSAPGAEAFRRVIFQNRTSEGHASRSSNDFSKDDYYCLSFQDDTTRRDALDAVSCASVFRSDKGRFITETDIDSGYGEPVESQGGEARMRPLDFHSLYPPRRDVVRCTGSQCYDHPDVADYDDEARRVMPDIDAISMATPAGELRSSLSFAWPPEWEDGEYELWIEVNTEGDYNPVYNDESFNTPGNQGSNWWDYWALSFGYPYRGQPSVVYRVPLVVGTDAIDVDVSEPEAYGSIHGWGEDGDVLHGMDPSITDDPNLAPGSGADRLLLQMEADREWRIHVAMMSEASWTETCQDNPPPSAVDALAVHEYPERSLAHRWATMEFLAPSDDTGISRYEVRISPQPIEPTEDSFARAQPANAASLESIGLEIDPGSPEGVMVEAGLGQLQPLTTYWVAVRAIDTCNEAGPISVVEFETPEVEYTTVSPCFVATAAYGTPMTAEISALRRVRDRYLNPHPIGRAFVELYERYGSLLADQIRDDDARRSWTRTLLAPVVALARLLTE